MCAHADKLTPEELAQLTGLHVEKTADKGGLANPTDLVPVITDDQPNKIQYFQWRLIPYWAKGEWKAATINARFEEVEEKASFKHLLGKRHCVIIFKSFYESVAVPGMKKKQQFTFSRTDGEPMYFAGLWDRWLDPQTGIVINSCTSLTLDVNEFMEKYHDRMPAILFQKDIKTWLDPELNWQERRKLIKKFPSELLQVDKAAPDLLSRKKKSDDQGEQGALPF